MPPTCSVPGLGSPWQAAVLKTPQAPPPPPPPRPFGFSTFRTRVRTTTCSYARHHPQLRSALHGTITFCSSRRPPPPPPARCRQALLLWVPPEKAAAAESLSPSLPETSPLPYPTLPFWYNSPWYHSLASPLSLPSVTLLPPLPHSPNCSLTPRPVSTPPPARLTNALATPAPGTVRDSQGAHWGGVARAQEGRQQDQR